MRFRNSTR